MIRAKAVRSIDWTSTSSDQAATTASQHGFEQSKCWWRWDPTPGSGQTEAHRQDLSYPFKPSAGSVAPVRLSKQRSVQKDFRLLVRQPKTDGKNPKIICIRNVISFDPAIAAYNLNLLNTCHSFAPPFRAADRVRSRFPSPMTTWERFV